MYFFRVDKRNNPIAGSLVKLNHTPKGKEWKRLVGYDCCGCDPVESNEVDTDTPITVDGEIPANCSVSAVLITPDGVQIGDLESILGGNISELLDLLNTQYSEFGTFVYNHALNKIIFTPINCGPYTVLVEAVCER